MSYTAPSVAASGISFATWQSDGASGHLEALITANLSATAAPTSAPTLSQTGSGATLPAATYYVVVTESNGFGETTASPASTGQAITLGQNLVVTFPSLKTGNVSRNTYVGTGERRPVHPGGQRHHGLDRDDLGTAADEQLRRQPADGQHDRAHVHRRQQHGAQPPARNAPGREGRESRACLPVLPPGRL